MKTPLQTSLMAGFPATEPTHSRVTGSDAVLMTSVAVVCMLTLGPSASAASAITRTVSETAVILSTMPDAAVTTHGVEEVLPPGAEPKTISDSGVWDTRNRKVKWGVFYDNVPRELAYTLQAPLGDHVLSGTGSFDGETVATDGPSTVTVRAASIAGRTFTLAGEPSAQQIRLVSDIPSSGFGMAMRDHEVVSVGSHAAGVLFSLDGLGLGNQHAIDALLVHSNQILFSTDLDFLHLGVRYADEDLVQFDANSGVLTTVVDGSAMGLPTQADIDAACFEHGTSNILFSLANSVEVPGLGDVRPGDILRCSGSALSFAYLADGDLGIPRGANVNGLLQSASTLYLSLDIPVRMAGIAGRHNDLWSFASGSGAVGLVENAGLVDGADLAAVDMPLDSDNDGLTDFEESSGLDESATTIEGTGKPLSPNGHTSDPFAEDTDRDGHNDGQEGIAGTDPRDATDILRITAVHCAGGSNTVIWASEPGRAYDLLRGQSVTSITDVVADAVPSAPGDNTSVTDITATNAAAFYRVGIRN